MAKVSIGDLVVKITASADQFESAISKSEKRLAGFAAKATAPLTGVAGGLGHLPGLLTTPLDTARGSLNRKLGVGKRSPRARSE